MTAKDQSNPGQCFWVAYLKDGALRENSPNHIGQHCN
jgi:hypothetical protein